MENTPNYRQITTCTESYFDRLGDSALGMGWPNMADAVKRYQVMLDLIRPQECRAPELLDFGCGTGHLYEYIRQQDLAQIQYHGIDLSEQFIAAGLSKHPTADFQCADILLHPECLGYYDYVVINGVFTSRCQMSFEEMFDFVQRVVRLLYSRCRYGLAFNTMSKQVDWERDDLFHLPLDHMAEFVCRDLGRNFMIRNDYGLYEYTTYVYREQASAQT